MKKLAGKYEAAARALANIKTRDSAFSTALSGMGGILGGAFGHGNEGAAIGAGLGYGASRGIRALGEIAESKLSPVKRLAGRNKFLNYGFPAIGGLKGSLGVMAITENPGLAAIGGLTSAGIFRLEAEAAKFIADKASGALYKGDIAKAIMKDKLDTAKKVVGAGAGVGAVGLAANALVGKESDELKKAACLNEGNTMNAFEQVVMAKLAKMSERMIERTKRTAKKVTRVPPKGVKPKPLTGQQTWSLADPMKDAFKTVEGVTNVGFGGKKFKTALPQVGNHGTKGLKDAMIDTINKSRNRTIDAKRAKQKATKAHQKKFFSSGFEKDSAFHQGFMSKMAEFGKKYSKAPNGFSNPDHVDSRGHDWSRDKKTEFRRLAKKESDPGHDKVRKYIDARETPWVERRKAYIKSYTSVSKKPKKPKSTTWPKAGRMSGSGIK